MLKYHRGANLKANRQLGDNTAIYFNFTYNFYIYTLLTYISNLLSI